LCRIPPLQKHYATFHHARSKAACPRTGEGTQRYSRGAILRPSLGIQCPSGKRRAQGMPGAQPHPQSSWAEKENAHKSSGRAEIARHSLRNGFTAAPRSPWGTGLSSPHREQIISVSLDPSVGGSGPHGLTVRDCTARLAAQRVHHNPRRVSWRSRNAPPERRGMSSLNHNFCVPER